MSDEEYHRQLKKFVQDVRTSLSIKKSFERLVQIGRRTGLTDIQIGDDIRAEFKGELPDVTIRKYLPPSFKHQEKSNIRYSDAIHVSHPKTEIPAPSERVEEVEIVPEPPKAVDKPINTPSKDQVFLVGKHGFPYNYDQTFSSRMDNVFVIVTCDNVIRNIESIGRKLARKMYPDIPIKDT